MYPGLQGLLGLLGGDSLPKKHAYARPVFSEAIHDQVGVRARAHSILHLRHGLASKCGSCEARGINSARAPVSVASLTMALPLTIKQSHGTSVSFAAWNWVGGMRPLKARGRFYRSLCRCCPSSRGSQPRLLLSCLPPCANCPAHVSRWSQADGINQL